MAIEVYPSTMQGEPVEVYDAGNMTLGHWLSSKGIAYERREHQPIVIVVNGCAIAPVQWPEYRFTSSDRIQILCIPQGGAFNALGSIISKVFNVAFGFLMPKTKNQGSRNTPSGDRLEPSNATANQARLGEAVSEHAGTFRRFPDYLTQPRRFFVNKREQHVTFLSCVGVGSYYIDPATIKIGDTPFSVLGDAAQYETFPPGADVSGNWAHDNWYSVEEVGGTSSGTAGLELSTEPGNRGNTDPSQYYFNNGSIERNGSFPVAWGVGTQVQVSYPRLYDVVTHVVPPSGGGDAGESGGYSVSRVTGYFGHVASGVGEIVAVGGFDTSTRYRVRTVVAQSEGIKTLEFETVNGSGFDEPGSPVLLPAGLGQTYRFGSNVNRGITTFADESLGVAPGGFEEGVVEGAQVRFSGGVIYGEWSSEFATAPASENTEVFEFDVFFPNGLAYISDSGGLSAHSVGIEFQYRNLDGGPRVTASWFYEESTLDQIGFTERITTSRGRWMVRMRRVMAESTSTQVQDKVVWYGLRSMLPTRSNYPNWTTIAIRLSSGGKLGANAENKINLIATRVLPELRANGQWSNPVPTRHIAAFFRYILTTIGYTDNQIDMAELRRLNDVWNVRGDTFNHVFSETTVKEALDTVLAAGMSELTIEDGRIRPVRDERRTVFEQSYSAQNMTSPLRTTFKSPRVDDVDGVEVEYTDEETWTKAAILCLLPGDAGRKLEKISLKGAFDRTRAWRIGMRRRRVLRYRNREYSFSTEMDALNSRYLSYVPLIDDDSEYSQSAILTHISTHEERALLRVTEPLNWQEGANHVVAYRNLEGMLVGPFTATPGPDEYSLFAEIPQPYPVITLKHEPPHVYFGTTTQWSFPALITGVTPQGLDAVNVTAENDHPAVYDDDDASPPA